MKRLIPQVLNQLFVVVLDFEVCARVGSNALGSYDAWTSKLGAAIPIHPLCVFSFAIQFLKKEDVPATFSRDKIGDRRVIVFVSDRFHSDGCSMRLGL